MNLWDSVHRGLEKASQEAGRIARVQRTRSAIDKLTHQIETNEKAVLHKAMELYTTGRLTQPELLPICQELMYFHQQLAQSQAELKQLQSQAPPTPQPAPNHYTQPGDVYNTPSSYSSVPLDGTLPATVVATQSTTPPPPPPPGVDPLTISAKETLIIGGESSEIPPPPPPPDAAAYNEETYLVEAHTPARPQSTTTCPSCGTPASPNNQFCHNCGTALQPSAQDHQPTVRAGTQPSIATSGQETVRASEPTSEPESEGEH